MIVIDNWSLEDSKIVYGIGKSDLHFLTITSEGKLAIQLFGKIIPLEEIFDDILEQNNTLEHVPSFTLRIPQLIETQVQKLIGSFKDSIKKHDYPGYYQPLYPIKVNPRIEVLTTIMNANANYGLEAGTKSELILILKEIGDEESFDRLIMCNGIKDAEYIELVGMALDDGYNIIISIESIEECETALERLPRDKLKLALRIKPYATVEGHWSGSTGRNSKFGLTIANLFAVEQLLISEKAQDSVVAIHSHPGSQMTSSFIPYTRFLAKIYNQLYSKGFNQIKFINFGGGLAIDYDGHLPDNMFEIYTDEIIGTLNKFIDSSIPKPNVITESGRAVTALASMVVIETIDYRMLYPGNGNGLNHSSKFDRLIQLVSSCSNLKDIERVCNDWFMDEEHLQDLDSLHLYEKETVLIRKAIREHVVKADIPLLEVLRSEILIECYMPDYITIGNFSVFNSVCDHVLIKQYFPMMPVENLHIKPETIVRLVDITCDSDGEISIFTPTFSDKQPYFTSDYYPVTLSERVELRGFPVGKVEQLSESYIAIALVGAYQDIIEMDHNLLGDLPEVNLEIEKNNPDPDAWKVTWLEPAQNIQDLVKEVGYTIEQHESPFLRKKKYKNGKNGKNKKS